MRPVNLLRFATPVALAGSLFVQACTTATPSLTPSPVAATEASSWPSPSPTPIPTATTRPGPTPTPDAGRDPISVDSSLYRDMPVNLELKVMCGLCGPEGWLSELPRFRLYADGLAVFRGQADDPLTASYRVVHLDEQGHESLIRYALDEGGLRGAAAHYRGNADDAGTIRFALHAQFVDDGADVDVDLEPVIGNGTTDVFGDPMRTSTAAHSSRVSPKPSRSSTLGPPREDMRASRWPRTFPPPRSSIQRMAVPERSGPGRTSLPRTSGARSLERRLRASHRTRLHMQVSGPGEDHSAHDRSVMVGWPPSSSGRCFQVMTAPARSGFGATWSLRRSSPTCGFAASPTCPTNP